MESQSNIICNKIKSILLFFYPNDSEFINILFNKGSKFEGELSAWINNNYNKKEIYNFNNKFYGVNDSVKKYIYNDDINNSIFYLNKSNIDILFSIILECSLQKDFSALKSKVLHYFSKNNFKEISFASNSVEYISSNMPINFFALCLSIKVLFEYFNDDINELEIGVFLNYTIYNILYYDLFCGYLVCLYFYFENKNKREKRLLTLNYLNDESIYENLTFHYIKTDSSSIKKNEDLSMFKNYSIIEILNNIFEDIDIYNIKLNVYIDASKSLKDEIFFFLKNQKQLKTLAIQSLKSFLEGLYLFDINSNQIEINILDNNDNNKKIDDIISERILLSNQRIKSIILKGRNIYFEEIPKFFENIKKLEYYSILTKNGPLTKKINNINIIQNIQNIVLNSISLSEFINYFIDNKFNFLKSADITLFPSQQYYLKKHFLTAINTFIISNPSNILEILKIKINQKLLLNQGNNIYKQFFLSKPNCYYFIDLVLRNLNKCYYFALTNHLDNYQSNPIDDKSQEFTLNEFEGCTTYSNKYSLVLSYVVSDNTKYIISDKNKYSLGLCHENLDTFYALLFSISKKMRKIKQKPILYTLLKFIIRKRERFLLVGDYNN